MKHEETELSRDGVLMWLNDWRRRRVFVTVALRTATSFHNFFETEGELRHWTDGGDAVNPDDDAGRYCVGCRFTVFDISDPALPAASFRVVDIGPGGAFTGAMLVVDFGGEVQINVQRMTQTAEESEG